MEFSQSYAYRMLGKGLKQWAALDCPEDKIYLVRQEFIDNLIATGQPGDITQVGVIYNLAVPEKDAE